VALTGANPHWREERRSVTDQDEPVKNYCASCGVAIGDQTGLCGDCAKVEAGDASRNGDNR
jgi:hypothetical protein